VLTGREKEFSELSEIVEGLPDGPRILGKVQDPVATAAQVESLRRWAEGSGQEVTIEKGNLAAMLLLRLLKLGMLELRRVGDEDVWVAKGAKWEIDDFLDSLDHPLDVEAAIRLRAFACGRVGWKASVHQVVYAAGWNLSVCDIETGADQDEQGYRR
jgi:hypothetical protein